MAVDVLYFAWVRQRVGTGAESISLPTDVNSVSALITHLQSLSDGHEAGLHQPERIRVSVNQEFVALDHPVNDGDEVAFFPPVTGG